MTAVGTFCMFGKIDVLKFCFYIFDKDKNGYIEEDELHCLVDVLQGSGGYSNTKQALLGAFDGDGDGKMSFAEFCGLHAKYPQMLHPAFRIQDSIAQNTLGRDWWANKKNTFHKGRVKEADDIKKEKQAFLDAQVARQKRQIKRKMGLVNYYLNCAQRRRYLAQIVVVDPDEEAAKKKAALAEAQSKQAAEQERMFKAKQAKENGDWTLKGKKQKDTIKSSSKSTKEDRAARRAKRREKQGKSPGRRRQDPSERPSKKRGR